MNVILQVKVKMTKKQALKCGTVTPHPTKSKKINEKKTLHEKKTKVVKNKKYISSPTKEALKEKLAAKKASKKEDLAGKHHGDKQK